MSNSHKYIDKEWKNGRWVYYYPQQKPHQRFNPHNIESFSYDFYLSHPDVTYKDGFGNVKIVNQSKESTYRNRAAIVQDYQIKQKKAAHQAQYLKERETYVDRRNKAGKRQNRSGEAVKASYKTTPVSKIKSTFRRISSHLGNIKLSSIFK